MSSLPEHARITLERVTAIDAELEALRTAQITLRQERKELIDSEAQKIAKLSVGQEMDVSYRGFRGKSKTRRYRIIEVGGDYSIIPQLPDETHFLWVKYRGQLIKKDGTLGEETRPLYPDESKLIEPQK